MSPKSKRHYPRKTWLVRPKLQWGVALTCFVVQMVAVLVYQAAFQIMGLGQPSAIVHGVEMHLTGDVVASSFLVMLLTCGVCGLLATLFGLWASHRIYGPLPRIRRAFREAIDGDWSVRLKLRPGDTLDEIADDFNDLMQSLDQRSDGLASDWDERESTDASFAEDREPLGAPHS